jgi:hypothetical protein
MVPLFETLYTIIYSLIKSHVISCNQINKIFPLFLEGLKKEKNTGISHFFLNVSVGKERTSVGAIVGLGFFTTGSGHADNFMYNFYGFDTGTYMYPLPRYVMIQYNANSYNTDTNSMILYEFCVFRIQYLLNNSYIASVRFFCILCFSCIFLF